MSNLPTGTWTIDPMHSEVGFTVRHLMSKVRGRFTEFSGEIVTKSENPADATVNATIEMGSVDTNNEMRDGHLRSAEVFNADNNPQMTFVSTGITGTDEAYTINGDLTINGVTRPVALDAEFFGVDTDQLGNTKLGAEASTKINRKDFNVDFNIPLDGGRALLGNDITVTLTVQAALNVPAEAH